MQNELLLLKIARWNLNSRILIITYLYSLYCQLHYKLCYISDLIKRIIVIIINVFKLA